MRIEDMWRREVEDEKGTALGVKYDLYGRLRGG